MKRFDIRMGLAITEDARNRLPLLGDPQAFVGAQCFDVDIAAHALKLSISSYIVQRAILFAAAGPLALGAEPNRLRQSAPLFGIVGGYHWVIGREAPFITILVRSHVVVRHEMPLKHLEPLPVLQADNVVRLD